MATRVKIHSSSFARDGRIVLT